LIIAVSFLATGTVYAATMPKRQSLRKPLITAEQKNRDRLASTAALLKLRRDLINGRYLAERFDDYATTIRSTVNPDLDAYVIAVGGTGPNISAPLLDTFFTKAYFIDVIEFSVDKLKKWHEPINWELYNVTSKNAYFTYKRYVGWIDTNTFEKNPEERFIMELKAMGVNREDVKIDVDDKGRPVVEFKLPGDNKTRKIVFIHQDLFNLDEELHSELKGKLDAYHQKGVLSVTNSYGKYLSSISEWIKPEGFLILNNYDKDEQFEDPELYINNQFVHYLHKMESSLLSTLNYGWKMSLYRKVQSSAEETIPPLKQKHSVASKDTILNSEGEAFDNIWTRMAKQKLRQGVQDPRHYLKDTEEKELVQAYGQMSLEELSDVLVDLIKSGTIEISTKVLSAESPLLAFIDSLSKDYNESIIYFNQPIKRIKTIKENIRLSKNKGDFNNKKKRLNKQLLNNYRYKAFLRELTDRWQKPKEDFSILLGIIRGQSNASL